MACTASGPDGGSPLTPSRVARMLYARRRSAST